MSLQSFACSSHRFLSRHTRATAKKDVLPTKVGSAWNDHGDGWKSSSGQNWCWMDRWQKNPRWERQSEGGDKESQYSWRVLPGESRKDGKSQTGATSGQASRARTMIKQKMSTANHRSTKVTAEGHWAQVEEAAKHNRDRGLD